jgi:hypothetical protein
MYKSFLFYNYSQGNKISLVIVYYKSSACVNVNFLDFPMDHMIFLDVMIGCKVLAAYSECEFECRGYFRKPLWYFAFYRDKILFLCSGSSNQLGECIIKHHDLVLFAQRIVWIKVFCRVAKDRSWLVELYRVKLKFLKIF